MPKHKIKGPVDGKLVATLDGPALLANPECKENRARKAASELKNTTVLLLLSITGNDRCKDIYLQASLEKSLNDHKFVNCLVADQLQWHNKKCLNSNETLDQAFKQQAVNDGDEYLIKNLPYFLSAIENQYPNFEKNNFLNENSNKHISEQITILNQQTFELGIPFKITRWKDLVSELESDPSHDFPTNLDKIMALYNTPGSELSKSLKAAVNYHTKNPDYKDIPVDELFLRMYQSKGYFSEESALITLFVKLIKIDLIAYAGQIPSIFGLVRKVLDALDDPIESNPLNTYAETPEKPKNELKIKFKRVAIDKNLANTLVPPTLDKSIICDSYIKPIPSSTLAVNCQSDNFEENSGPNSKRKILNQDLKPAFLARSKSEQFLSVSGQRAGFFFQDMDIEPVEKPNNSPLTIKQLENLLASFANGINSAETRELVKVLSKHITFLMDRPQTPVPVLCR